MGGAYAPNAPPSAAYGPELKCGKELKSSSLGRNATASHAKRENAAIAEYVSWSVCLCVYICMSASLLVTAVGPTKTAEPLEVPRGMDLGRPRTIY